MSFQFSLAVDAQSESELLAFVNRSSILVGECPEAHRFDEIKENSGDRDRIKALKPQCSLIQVSPKACDGCPANPERGETPSALPAPLEETRAILRDCLRDLSLYGNRLVEIEIQHRQSLLKKINRKRLPPINVDKLMQLPEVQELNRTVDMENFEKAFELIRRRSLGFFGVDLRPPWFFQSAIKLKGADPATSSVFCFFMLCSLIHPARWRKCQYCEDFFLAKRIQDRAKFCPKPKLCKDNFHNDRRREEALRHVESDF